MASESKKDMIAKRGEPHHPFEVCNILQQKRTRYWHKTSSALCLHLTAVSSSIEHFWDKYHVGGTHHFPAKIMPSWLHTVSEGLSVYVL